jgi:hypothetical protein
MFILAMYDGDRSQTRLPGANPANPPFAHEVKFRRVQSIFRTSRESLAMLELNERSMQAEFSEGGYLLSG